MKMVLGGLVLGVTMMFAGQAHATGTFKLTVQGSTTTQELNISESAGDYFGTLTTNGTPVSVATARTGDSITLYIGNDVSILTASQVDTTTTYTGDFAGRAVTINVEAKGAKQVYDGSVGTIDDLTGKSNSGKDRLVLFWGKNKLRLSDGATSGTCAGTLESPAG
ncbi:MAG TPA: hypothetical protein VFV50_07380, partial [Bdellovibrionales bacterium]|nr:hypothetical protein [Bdellovibrionales bacterium]